MSLEKIYFFLLCYTFRFHLLQPIPTFYYPNIHSLFLYLQLGHEDNISIPEIFLASTKYLHVEIKNFGYEEWKFAILSKLNNIFGFILLYLFFFLFIFIKKKGNIFRGRFLGPNLFIIIFPFKELFLTS